MSNDVEIAFTELFFGSGSWLGILLLLSIITVLVLKDKFVALLMIPVTLFLGMDYLDNSLYWNSMIMFLSSIFLLLNLIRNRNG